MRNWKLISVLLIIFFVAFGLVFILFYLPVYDISCENQYGVCSEKIDNELKSIEGKNITTSKRKINDLLSKDFTVKKFSISYKLPNKFVIHLVERKANFALQNPDSQKTALVDNEGRVLNYTGSSQLPTVEVNRELPQVGEVVSNEELNSLKLVSQIYSLFKINKSIIENDSLKIYFAEGKNAILPLDGDKRILLGSLILVLNKIEDESDKDVRQNLEGKENITIDFRYKNPVIR